MTDDLTPEELIAQTQRAVRLLRHSEALNDTTGRELCDGATYCADELQRLTARRCADCQHWECAELVDDRGVCNHPDQQAAWNFWSYDESCSRFQAKTPTEGKG